MGAVKGGLFLAKMVGAGVLKQNFLDSAPGLAAICCAALSCCLDLAICKMGRMEDQNSHPSPGDGESLLKPSALQSVAERLWGVWEDFSQRLSFAALPVYLFLLWDGDPK